MSATLLRSAMLRGIASSLLCAGLAAGALPASAAGVAAPQSPWLAIDRNRASIVTSIVERWRDTAATHRGQPGVLTDEQLRDALEKLRADNLFAASLAGSYAALVSTLADAGALDATPTKVNAKTGNLAPELVYTAITPCRIIDTRHATGGTAIQGTTRNWLASNPSGTFATQGGSATNCNIPIKPAAVVTNITIFNNGVGPAFLVAYPFGVTRPSAATLNWVAGNTQLANNATLTLCQGPACTSDFSMFVSQTTDFVMDVVGYMSSPSGGNVLSVAPSGAQYSSIQAAIDAAITMGAADNNSFIVKVAPGVYHEQVTLKDWVDVYGSGTSSTAIVYTGVGPAMIAGAQSVVRDIGIFGYDTVSNPAIAVQQTNTTSQGFTSLQWTSIGADSGAGSGVSTHDNIGVNIDNGFIHILNSDVGTGLSSGAQTAIVGSNSANIRFANGRLTPSAAGSSRLAAKQNPGAVVKIDNTEIRGTTSGTPSCVYVFAQNYTPTSCP